MSEEIILFCPSCFASQKDGSWNHTVVNNFCSNCGSCGSSVSLPEWAVESIRKQASWVGKRYYPHQEDKELSEEIKILRNTIKIMPGRSVKFHRDGVWCVSQQTGISISSIFVQAGSAEEALAKSHDALPYCP